MARQKVTAGEGAERDVDLKEKKEKATKEKKEKAPKEKKEKAPKEKKEKAPKEKKEKAPKEKKEKAPKEKKEKAPKEKKEKPVKDVEMSDDSGEKKKKRKRNQEVAANSAIRTQQKIVKLVFPRATFKRLVKECVADSIDTDKAASGDKSTTPELRVESNAVLAIQVATENTLLEILQNGVFCKDMTIANRQKLESRDLLGPINANPDLKPLYVDYISAKRQSLREQRNEKVIAKVQEEIETKSRKKQKTSE
jgi:hypothetical protein